MLERLTMIIQQESFAERSQRIIPAAIFAALIATAYVFTFFLVNVYSFPSLPLAVDWGGCLGCGLDSPQGLRFLAPSQPGLRTNPPALWAAG
jgi:hypothetical protein